MKIDKSMFKGKDLGLVNEVVDYLKGYDLDLEVWGSVNHSAEKENPRNYRDIDLIVRYDGSKARYDALMGLVWGMNDVKDHSLKIPSFVEKIADYNQEGQFYVNLPIDNRFTIVNDKTKTIIDLCFEKKPLARNKPRLTIESECGLEQGNRLSATKRSLDVHGLYGFRLFK